MFAYLEQELGVTLPISSLFKAPTIERLAALIRKGAAAAPQRSIVAIQSAGTRPPVFGLPGLMGIVLGYNSLARLLGPDQPFYGLESRGLDGLQEPLTRIEDIAAAWVREMRAVQPEGPYYLVGQCMGGVVAYEMAQQLRAVGQETALLALIDTWAPETQSARTLPRRGRAFAALSFVAGRARTYVETFARLDRRERFPYVLSRLKLLADIAFRRDLFRGARGEFFLHAVARANLLAFRQYKPRGYPGLVLLFRASGKDVAPSADYRLAWLGLTTGGLEIYSVPGDDSGLMMQEPHVGVLAAQLKARIERTLTVGAPAELRLRLALTTPRASAGRDRIAHIAGDHDIDAERAFPTTSTS